MAWPPCAAKRSKFRPQIHQEFASLMMAQATFVLGLFYFAKLLALACKAKALHIKYGPLMLMCLSSEFFGERGRIFISGRTMPAKLTMRATHAWNQGRRPPRIAGPPDGTAICNRRISQRDPRQTCAIKCQFQPLGSPHLGPALRGLSRMARGHLYRGQRRARDRGLLGITIRTFE